MSTITIKNSPINKTMAYTDCIIIEKNNISAWLNLLKQNFYDSKKETYGPFEWKDAISFLNILDYEDTLS